MKMSRRAARMERQHQRGKTSVTINLVSLMDIFTILVFFLLVNSSDGEILPTHKSIALPESVSEEQPRQTVVIMVNPDNVLMNGEVIASVDRVLAEPGQTSALIQAAMARELQKTRQRPGSDTRTRIEATILGDKSIPYSLLKKVMATATLSGYHRISLAVLQRPLEEI